MISATNKFAHLIWILVVVIATNCSDGENENEVGADISVIGDAGTPAAVFKNLSAYDVLKGKIKIEAEGVFATKLELMVGEKTVGTLSAPSFSFTWDTTTTQDGIVKLSLQAHGKKGNSITDEVQVIVLNKGTEASYLNGINSGEITIPKSGVDDTHVNFHWIMPNDGIQKVMALLFWGDKNFDMKMSIGVGCCASTGHVGADNRGKTAPVVVTYKAAGNMQIPASMKWFVDIVTTNASKVAGKKTSLYVKVYLLK